MPATNSPCINWNKAIDRDGYGKTSRGGKTYFAHRLAYEDKYGKIDSPLDHLCRNRACVNVDHLEPVSIAENTRRGSSAKLTYSLVEKIKELYATGQYRQKHLAEMFGVGQYQISRIVNNKRWGIV